MSQFSNETPIPYGVVAAGRPNVNYLRYRPTPVTRKAAKGVPGMDLTIKATVDSPRTRRSIRRSVNGAFGKEKLLTSEFSL